MNDAIEAMLARYRCRSADDYENALKEIIQEVALLGLWRAKFFERAAFYGGSALRILYQLDRFSEDLDFSLLKPDGEFSLSEYTRAIEFELESFGFSVVMEQKVKVRSRRIDSTFIKAGTLQNLMRIDTPANLVTRLHPRQQIKIKLEVDIDPPPGFNIEARYLFQPIPFSVNCYTQPDLFAGKLHVILCRSWEARVKGRDWYDLVWYVGRNIPVHLQHLEHRMRQSGDWKTTAPLTETDLKELLYARIAAVDFQQAKDDVRHFLKDAAPLALWSKDYFCVVCEKITVS